MSTREAGVRTARWQWTFDTDSDGVVVLRLSGHWRMHEHLERAASRAPTHHLVTVDDVGAMAACLVSDAARAMTGATAYVDGGYSIVA